MVAKAESEVEKAALEVREVTLVDSEDSVAATEVDVREDLVVWEAIEVEVVRLDSQHHKGTSFLHSIVEQYMHLILKHKSFAFHHHHCVDICDKCIANSP